MQNKKERKWAAPSAAQDNPLSWEEQELLAEKIRLRPLPRPKTKRSTIAALLLLYFLLAFLIAFAATRLFQMSRFAWAVYVGSYLILGYCFLKVICIKAVQCYQHYAKEETRRKCTCIPSCSEYAIAVLKKYPVLKALHKIRIRLFKTCGGYGYMRDEP